MIFLWILPILIVKEKKVWRDTRQKERIIEREKVRDLRENYVLSRAWNAVLKDSVAGFSQRGNIVYETSHYWISDKAPNSNSGVEGSYGLEFSNSVRKKVKNLSKTFKCCQRRCILCVPASWRRRQKTNRWWELSSCRREGAKQRCTIVGTFIYNFISIKT